MLAKMKLVFVLLVMSGCTSNPSIENINSQALGQTSAHSVLVARFEGNPEFVDESTSLFVSVLTNASPVNVKEGGPVRTEGIDIVSGTNLPSPEMAAAYGKQNASDIVVIGKVTSHHTDGMLNGFSTVKVIRTSDGQILATFHEPSGLLVADSEHEAVMAAVKRTAKEVAQILK